ncbi:ORFA9.5 [Alcelaphine gammaherpesvirus 1]|uniref:A9.5 protein n=1 Tax=Alcelaphine gammaherpesvirus 1 TaxID=35252 RepID=K0KYW9_9GAMA|nr:ORFA9.5 [Alcelaphine gammaherpesvirus 1]QDY92308.1 glycoprotein A9.5 [Alcelaphine gammaherpesvirus 1]CCI51261.1 A9.5 protein precursor [Alcelaphine gammaherpesvirus 1]
MEGRRVLLLCVLSILFAAWLQPNDSKRVKVKFSACISHLKDIVNISTDCFNITWNNNNTGCENATIGNPDKRPGLPCRECLNLTLTNNSTECQHEDSRLQTVLGEIGVMLNNRSIRVSGQFENTTCSSFVNITLTELLGSWLSMLQKSYAYRYCGDTSPNHTKCQAFCPK